MLPNVFNQSEHLLLSLNYGFKISDRLKFSSLLSRSEKRQSKETLKTETADILQIALLFNILIKDFLLYLGHPS